MTAASFQIDRLLAPLALAGVLLCMLRVEAPAEQLNGGLDGYKVLVDQLLIEQRIIRTTNAVDGLAQGMPTGSAPLVTIDDARLESPDLTQFGAEKLRGFLRESSIRAEIARNAPETWHIDNSLIEIQRNAGGRFLSPFAFSDWSGLLLFAGNTPAGRWAVRVGEADWAPISSLLGEGQGGWAVSRCKSGCSFEVVATDPASHATGLALTLSNHTWKGELPVYCATSEPIPRGEDTRGVCLELRRQRLPPLQLIFLSGSNAISADSEAQPGYHLSGLAGAVRSAKSSWVQQGCDGNCTDKRSDPIATTLDRELTIFAQESLDAVYDSGVPLRRPAGVTIMDADSGAILALASRYGPEVEGATAALNRDDVNFMDLPIGSVAKPLIASAIFLSKERDAAPGNWDGLHVNQVAASSAARQLLGIPLDGTMNLHSVGTTTWINASDFITHSSNYYAAALMLLSCSAERPTPRDRKWWSADLITDAPGAAPCVSDSVATTFALPWLNTFVDMYGPISTDTLALWGGEDNRYMPKPANFAWLEQSETGQPKTRTDLTSFRTQVAPMILGGQDFQWSNVLVAQSFARLVTGKRVFATLVEPSRNSAPVLKRGNWERLSAGLLDVPRVGTAKQLSPLVAGFRVLAKTGTPEVETTNADLSAENAQIRNDYEAVRRLIPPDKANQPGWASFEHENVRYQMYNGRVVSAGSLAVSNFFAKTFVFFICRPDASANCNGRKLVGFITVQDPNEGTNRALMIAERLLAPSGKLKTMLEY